MILSYVGNRVYSWCLDCDRLGTVSDFSTIDVMVTPSSGSSTLKVRLHIAVGVSMFGRGTGVYRFSHTAERLSGYSSLAALEAAWVHSMEENGTKTCAYPRSYPR